MLICMLNIAKPHSFQIPGTVFAKHSCMLWTWLSLPCRKSISWPDVLDRFPCLLIRIKRYKVPNIAHCNAQPLATGRRATFRTIPFRSSKIVSEKTYCKMPHLEVPAASLYYETAGKGPLLLCISGATGDAASWTPLVHSLKDRFTVVTYDRK